jgi:dienelactone hydrolase
MNMRVCLFGVAFGSLLLGLACHKVETESWERRTVVQFDPAPTSPSADELVRPAVPQPSDFLLSDQGQVEIPTILELAVKGVDAPVETPAFSTATAAQFVRTYLNSLHGFLADTATATSTLGAELTVEDKESAAEDRVFVLDVTCLRGTCLSSQGPLPGGRKALAECCRTGGSGELVCPHDACFRKDEQGRIAKDEEGNPLLAPVVAPAFPVKMLKEELCDIAAGSCGLAEGIVPAVVKPYDPESQATTIEIQPPLGGQWRQGAVYAVVVTTNLKDDTAQSVIPSYAFNFLKSVEPLAVAGDGEPLCGAETGCAAAGLSRCALPDADAVQLEALRWTMAPLFDHLEQVGVVRADGEEAQPTPITRGEIAQLWTFTILPEAIAINDPSAGTIPVPNDLLMTSPAGSQHDCDGDSQPDCQDGRLCFPIDCDKDSAAQKAFFTYMNSLDGWPASMTPTLSFTQPVTVQEAPPAALYRDDGEEGLKDLSARVELDAAATIMNVLSTLGAEAGAHYVAAVTRDLVTQGSAFPVAPSTVTALTLLEDPLFVEPEGGADGGPANQVAELGVSDEQAALLEALRQRNAALKAKLPPPLGSQGLAALWEYTIQSHNEALFDPTAGIVPFPNDVLMTLDDKGQPDKVNLPGAEGLPPLQEDLMEHINQLDGFSPLASASTRFLRPLDPKGFDFAGALLELPGVLDGTISLAMADITNVDPTQGIAGMTPLMVPDNIYAEDKVRATFENGSVVIRPKGGMPLRPDSRYMLIAFDSLDSVEQMEGGGAYPIEVAPVFFMARNPDPLFDEATGESLLSTLTDADAQQLEMLRSQYNVIFEAMESELLGVPRERVVMFWTFTTQSIGAFLKGLKDDLFGTLTVGDEPAGSLQEAELAGLDLKYADVVLANGKFTAYSALAAPEPEGEVPKMGRMEFDGKGKPKWTPYSFPYLLLVPKHDEGKVKLPAVIIQHGLGRSKEEVLVQADYYLEKGYVVVAGDLLYHGFRTLPGSESGDGFFSADAVATRDHMLQAALDLAQLAHFVAGGPLNQWLATELAGEVQIDVADVSYVGESLGGMVGALGLSLVEEIEKVALVVPGGHLTRILAETEDEGFKKPINDVLAGMGYAAGTPEYRQFMEMVQMLLDRGDPINYARHMAREPLGKTTRKVFILLSDKDEFMPKAASLELACAARDGKEQPYLKSYPATCHGFFFEPCAGGGKLDEAAVAAIKDILTFLAGGDGKQVEGAASGSALDCGNL